jgi:hypothetical protein
VTAGSGRVRRRVRRGPYAGAQKGWRDPLGYAYAAGSRASWPGAGCSAGRSACSPENSTLMLPKGTCKPDLPPEGRDPVRREAPSPQPLRAGDNGRCQASTRYGRADRGVKPGRRLAPEPPPHSMIEICLRFDPRYVGGSRDPQNAHASAPKTAFSNFEITFGSCDFASRPSGQQAMVLCAALGESATRRRGSDYGGRCRSAHRDRGDSATVDTRRTATDSRRVILRAQVVDNRVDAVLAVAHLTKEV